MNLLCDNQLKAQINRQIVRESYCGKGYDRITQIPSDVHLPYIDLTEVQQIYHVSPKKFYYLTYQEYHKD